MSANTAKMISTIFVWLVMGIIAIVTLTREGLDLIGGVILAVTLLAMATIVMKTIWGGPGIIGIRDENGIAGKSKRGSRREERLALLLDMLDDQEREAFKEALKRRVLEDADYADGELPYSSETIESLLLDENDKRRGR